MRTARQIREVAAGAGSTKSKSKPARRRRDALLPLRARRMPVLDARASRDHGRAEDGSPTPMRRRNRSSTASVRLMRRIPLKRSRARSGSPILRASRAGALSRRAGQRVQGRFGTAQSRRRLVETFSSRTIAGAADHVVPCAGAHHRDKMDGSSRTAAPRRPGPRSRNVAHEIKNPLSGIRARANCSSSRATRPRTAR